MFVLYNAARGVWRHRAKSLLAILVSAAVVFFLYLYVASMQNSKYELENLSTAIPVEARVSNLKGTMQAGLKIQPALLEELKTSPHVADLVYTIPLTAVVDPASNENNNLTEAAQLVCANTPAVYTTLADATTVYAPGWEEEFWGGGEAACLASDTILAQYGYTVGDMIPLRLFYHNYPGGRILEYLQLEDSELLVAGSYKNTPQPGGGLMPDLLCTTELAIILVETAGAEIYADSARFTVAAPLALNDFKQEMRDLGLLAVIPTADESFDGFGLTVYDGTFIQAAKRLGENLTLMQVFAPFVYTLVALVGFVASYLLLQSRQREFAIMRSLGTGRAACFAGLFLENLFLVLAGGLLGVLLGILFLPAGIATAGGVLLFFTVSYLLGTTLALLLLNRFSVMAVLAAAE